MDISLTWHGGPENNTLGKKIYSARYNEIIEVPTGSYDISGKTITGQNTFQTKTKHRLESVKAYINNIEYPVTEAKSIGYTRGYHFFLPIDLPTGYLIIRYSPVLEADWISDSAIANTICDSRSSQILASTLTDIRTNIDVIEQAVSAIGQTSIATKQSFYEDHLVELNDFTKVQLIAYQNTVLNIRNSLLLAYPTWQIPFTITPVSSNIILSKYVSEIRYALNTIRDVLNAEN